MTQCDKSSTEWSTAVSRFKQIGPELQSLAQVLRRRGALKHGVVRRVFVEGKPADPSGQKDHQGASDQCTHRGMLAAALAAEGWETWLVYRARSAAAALAHILRAFKVIDPGPKPLAARC